MLTRRVALPPWGGQVQAADARAGGAGGAGGAGDAYRDAGLEPVVCREFVLGRCFLRRPWRPKRAVGRQDY